MDPAKIRALADMSNNARKARTSGLLPDDDRMAILIQLGLIEEPKQEEETEATPEGA